MTLRPFTKEEENKRQEKAREKSFAKSENALSEGLIKKENLPKRRSIMVLM